MIKVELMEYPKEYDWIEVKRRALVTMGKREVVNAPTVEWKEKILNACHSPIRYLRFSFYVECPSWVATHLARHIHAQPYIKSQRNDRQAEYDRNKAPQDTPVCMIYDVNAEELLTIAHKRLCGKASAETREVVYMMCCEVLSVCPEFKDFLIPMCKYLGRCPEMQPCGKVSP